MKALIVATAIVLLTGCASNSNKVAVDTSQYKTMDCNQLKSTRNIHTEKADLLVEEQSDYSIGDANKVMMLGVFSNPHSESKKEVDKQASVIYAIESEMDNMSCSYTKWKRKYNIANNSPTM